MVAVLCGVQLVDVLGVTSATTAIPAIVAGLDAPSWTTGVVATAYAAFFGGFLVLGARLGDRYGHRRVLLAGLALLVVVAGVGAAAQDVWQVVAARALQGLAAAVGVPSALRLLLHAAQEPDRRRAAVAAWGATGAAAGALGFLVGGVFTDWWGWRSVFAVNVPVGVGLAVLVLALVPAPPPDAERPRVDWTGAALLAGAVMAAVVGASLVERPALRLPGVLVVLGALVGAAVLVLQQRRTPVPLVPQAALRSTALRTGTLLSFVNTATTSSTGVLVTLHLQDELGAGPLEAGLRLMPFSLAVVLGSAAAAPLAARLGDHRLSALGLAGVAAGNLALAATGGSRPGVLVGVVVAGLGLGPAAVAATSIGTRVPDALTGSASGVLNTGAQLGTALGVAALVTVAAAAGGGTGGAVVAWVAVAAIAAAGAVLAVSARRASRGGRGGAAPSPPPPGPR